MSQLIFNSKHSYTLYPNINFLNYFQFVLPLLWEQNDYVQIEKWPIITGRLEYPKATWCPPQFVILYKILGWKLIVWLSILYSGKTLQAESPQDWDWESLTKKLMPGMLHLKWCPMTNALNISREREREIKSSPTTTSHIGIIVRSFLFGCF